MGIPHARAELLALGSSCSCTNAHKVAGWAVDDWVLDADDIDGAIKTYEAVIAGGSSPDVHAILRHAGVDLDALLKAPQSASDLVTRADVVELIAAAAHLGWDHWPIDAMHMPNIAKMSRGKSDSGLDVTTVTLAGAPTDALAPDDQLFISSVKHTLDTNTASLRYNLVKSVTADLSRPYMAAQLRFLNGELVKAGMAPATAAKIFLLLRDWPDYDHVYLHAVAAILPAARTHLETQLVDNLPQVTSNRHGFRVLTIDGLDTLHERCP